MNRLRNVWLCALVGGVALITGSAPFSWGEIIKLKDGRVLDCDILSEDNATIKVQVQLASGGTQTRTIAKDEIAEITRLSEEQRAQREMVQAYQNTTKYKLDPSASYPLSYYDKVIGEVFSAFLTKYPGSPYGDEITKQTSRWQAERDQVASGKVKYRSQWLAAADAASLSQKDRAAQSLQQARNLIAQGQFKLALDRLAAMSAVEAPRELIAERRQLQSEAHRLWVASLESQHQQLETEIQTTKEVIARSQDTRSRAESAYNQARNNLQNADKRVLGDSAVMTQALGDLTRAQKELSDAQSRLSRLQERLDFTARTLTDVRRSSDAFAAAFPAPPAPTESSSPPTTAPPATSPPAPAPVSAPPPLTVLESVVSWLSKNWIYVGVGVLVAIWAVTRLLTKQ